MSDKDGVGEGKNPNDGSLQIGDKVYTAKDVENLVNREAALTQESQKVAVLRNAAEKYNVSVEDYVKNAEGAFGVTTRLMETGVIDEKGQLIKDQPDGKDKNNPTFKGDGQGDGENQVIADSRIDTVLSALSDINKRLDNELPALRQDADNVMKLGLRRDIMSAHSELDEKDAVAVLERFERNPRKDVWEHAKDYVEDKQVYERDQEERYAKRFGVDIEQYRKRNEQNVQGEGDGAAASLGERKLAFKHRAGFVGKDKAITPREAMEAHISKKLRR